jgi:hypothetical protein
MRRPVDTISIDDVEVVPISTPHSTSRGVFLSVSVIVNIRPSRCRRRLDIVRTPREGDALSLLPAVIGVARSVHKRVSTVHMWALPAIQHRKPQIGPVAAYPQ